MTIATLKDAVLRDMAGTLNNAQLKRLELSLSLRLAVAMGDAELQKLTERPDAEVLLAKFLAAKRLEGCSERTLKVYREELAPALAGLTVNVIEATTDDLRQYLDQYFATRQASKTTMDNKRRYLSTFYAWLESEDIILKSPMRRIHKVRTATKVKELYSDESVEKLREADEALRDIAMVDLLSVSGIRVGELVRLNRADIDLERRECVVFGKGDKERRVYFDARTKLHLQAYLAQRADDVPALFVSLKQPVHRIQIATVQARLKELGAKVAVEHVHPHKFRRTLATKAIDRGMPIEQVQKLLGHKSINTTLMYAQVDQTNVKRSHQKLLA